MEYSRPHLVSDLMPSRSFFPRHSPPLRSPEFQVMQRVTQARPTSPGFFLFPATSIGLRGGVWGGFFFVGGFVFWGGLGVGCMDNGQPPLSSQRSPKLFSVTSAATFPPLFLAWSPVLRQSDWHLYVQPGTFFSFSRANGPRSCCGAHFTCSLSPSSEFMSFLFTQGATLPLPPFFIFQPG